MFGLNTISEVGGILDWFAANWIIVFGIVLFLIIFTVVILAMI